MSHNAFGLLMAVFVMTGVIGLGVVVGITTLLYQRAANLQEDKKRADRKEATIREENERADVRMHDREMAEIRNQGAVSGVVHPAPRQQGMELAKLDPHPYA